MAGAHHIDFVARRVYFEVLVLDVGHHRKIDQNLDVFARQNRAVELEKVLLLVPAHDAMGAAQVCEQAASEIALMSDEEDVHLTSSLRQPPPLRQPYRKPGPNTERRPLRPHLQACRVGGLEG